MRVSRDGMAWWLEPGPSSPTTPSLDNKSFCHCFLTRTCKLAQRQRCVCVCVCVCACLPVCLPIRGVFGEKKSRWILSQLQDKQYLSRLLLQAVSCGNLPSSSRTQRNASRLFKQVSSKVKCFWKKENLANSTVYRYKSYGYQGYRYQTFQLIYFQTNCCFFYTSISRWTMAGNEAKMQTSIVTDPTMTAEDWLNPLMSKRYFCTSI